MLKQRRDNFQFGGKHKLNLKLTVFFYLTWKPDVFFRNAEVLNAGIKFVKKKLEFKTDLDHTQECERFSCCKMFTFVRNEISNIILRERCSVLTYDTSCSPVNFFYPFYSFVIALCVVWVLVVMNIFESLVELNLKTTMWNWRVWLIY